MSKIPVREWYARTNAEWEVGRVQCGGTLPIPSGDEAIKGARKLYRFATGKTWKGPVRLTSGRRSTWIRRGVLVVNPNGRDYAGKDENGVAKYLTGWETIVHCLSHYAHNGKPHCKAQAILEKNMIREVIKRGFLIGALKNDVPKVVEAIPEASRLLESDSRRNVRQSSVERCASKLAKIKERIKRWQSKAKRAENALKKLNRQAKYYEKRAA